MSNRDNKAAAAEFRELAGMDFDEFTRQAPVKLLLARGADKRLRDARGDDALAFAKQRRGNEAVIALLG